MKKILNSSLIIFCCLFFSKQLIAQIKVVTLNNVLVGNHWGATSSSEKFSVRGSSYFIEEPALSGLLIRNENWVGSGGSFNLTGIIPQWNSSTLLGTDNLRFFQVHTTELFVDGVWTTSDMQLKSNITQIGGKAILDSIIKLKTYSYDFKVENYANAHQTLKTTLVNNGKNQIGFMAQEVKQILPHLVRQDAKSGNYSVNYTAMIPLLLECIKEQQLQILELERKIALIKN